MRGNEGVLRDERERKGSSREKGQQKGGAQLCAQSLSSLPRLSSLLSANTMQASLSRTRAPLATRGATRRAGRNVSLEAEGEWHALRARGEGRHAFFPSVALRRRRVSRSL